MDDVQAADPCCVEPQIQLCKQLSSVDNLCKGCFQWKKKAKQHQENPKPQSAETMPPGFFRGLGANQGENRKEQQGHEQGKS